MEEVMQDRQRSQVVVAEQVPHTMELVIVAAQEQEVWLLFIINQIYKDKILCQS